MNLRKSDTSISKILEKYLLLNKDKKQNEKFSTKKLL